MVMPIGWLKIKCENCGWCKVVYQASDVVFAPKFCPQCQSHRLMIKHSEVSNILNLKDIFIKIRF